MNRCVCGHIKQMHRPLEPDRVREHRTHLCLFIKGCPCVEYREDADA